MKYYIVAGESSGDVHAANLVKNIFLYDKSAQIRAWGGEALRAAGATIVTDIAQMSFMGFVEILAGLRNIFRLLKFCQSDIVAYNPDVVILVDYPGFNLRIAKFAKRHGYKTIYFIAPQVWAWRKSRIKKIKLWVDEVIPILYFEEKFFADNGINVHYFGHPLVDEIKNAVPSEKNRTQDVIALLPGSRKSEIKRMLPVMMRVAEHFPTEKFVVSGMTVNGVEFYEKICENDIPANMSFVYDDMYGILEQAKTAVVTSGTATLETALFKVPQIVCYKTNIVTYLIARCVAKVKHISLVNLLLDKSSVPELIQNDCDEKKIVPLLHKLVEDETFRKAMLSDYDQLMKLLGSDGVLSKTAEFVVQCAAK